MSMLTSCIVPSLRHIEKGLNNKLQRYFQDGGSSSSNRPSNEEIIGPFDLFSEDISSRQICPHLLTGRASVEIGRGSYGSVLKAMDAATGGFAAIKVMDNHRSFSREVDTLKKLGPHPNIIGLQGFAPAGVGNTMWVGSGQTGSPTDRYCIVLDYMETSLYAIFKDAAG